MMETPSSGHQLLDIVLWIWFALTAFYVAYVAYDQFKAGPEQKENSLAMKTMRWGWVLVTLYTGVMIILMSRDMSAMAPTSVRFWGIMSLGFVVSTVTTFPVNWWLVKRGLKYGMGGEERASLRHSVSATNKLAAMFLTLAMLAGGIILATRCGNFSMRAGDSTDTKPMSSRASVELGRDLHR